GGVCRSLTRSSRPPQRRRRHHLPRRACCRLPSKERRRRPEKVPTGHGPNLGPETERFRLLGRRTASALNTREEKKLPHRQAKLPLRRRQLPGSRRLSSQGHGIHGRLGFAPLKSGGRACYSRGLLARSGGHDRRGSQRDQGPRVSRRRHPCDGGRTRAARASGPGPEGAGTGAGLADAAYEEAGAELLDSADQVFEQAELIVKVKEPLVHERKKLKRGQTLFTYLHLAADPKQAEDL